MDAVVDVDAVVRPEVAVMLMVEVTADEVFPVRTIPVVLLFILTIVSSQELVVVVSVKVVEALLLLLLAAPFALLDPQLVALSLAPLVVLSFRGVEILLRSPSS